MRDLLLDLKISVRRLLNRPVLLALAVLSTGVGMGAAATVFTWFKAVYLDPIPGVASASRLVTVNGETEDAAGLSNSYADFKHIQARARSFSGVIAHEHIPVSVVHDSVVEMIPAGIVSGNFFGTLGITPALGRGFLPAEDEVLDRDAVAVISHGLWQRRFGGREDVIGRRIELNRTPFTIVGVASNGFYGVYGGLRQDLWVPLHMIRALDPERRNRLASGSWMQIMARLNDGVALAEARSEVKVLSAAIRSSHRPDQPTYRAELFPLHQAQRGFHSGLFETVRMLAVAVGILLFMACLNMATLLISVGINRSREIAIRQALGAVDSRLLRLFLVESLLLACIGSLTGMVLAYWLRSLPQRFVGDLGEVYLNVSIDWRILLFLTSVTIVCALLFGMLPAMAAKRTNLADAMKAGAQSTTAGPAKGYLRNAMVSAQVALSVMALVCAGLFSIHAAGLMSVDRGFQTAGVVTANVDLFASGLTKDRGEAFYRQSAERIRQSAGVVSAAWTTYLPMSGSGGGNRRKVDGIAATAKSGKPVSVIVDAATPGYLNTMGIPLLNGLDFTWSDSQSSAPVTIVNKAFVDQYLTGVDPIGASIRVDGVSRTIVGVHANYTYRHPLAPSRPAILLPLSQDYAANATVVVKAAGGSVVSAGLLQSAVQDFDRNIALYRILPLEEHVGYQSSDARAIAGTAVVFGLFCCVLACFGLYSVLALWVSQRRRELGIRLALGATPSNLRTMVFVHSARLVSIGLTIGLMLAGVGALLLRSTLSGIRISEHWVFLAAVAGVGLVAVGATAVPARSATRTDPLPALRSE